MRPAGAPMVSVEPPSWARREGSPTTPAGAGEVAGEVREAATEIVVEAKDTSRQMAGDARRAANEQIDRRATVAGDRVGEAARDARGIAEHLRDQGREGPAKLADDAAQRMDRFADYLRDADTGRIMSDIKRIGREQPAALVAGAAVVGILVGRVVKASEPDDREGGAR